MDAIEFTAWVAEQHIPDDAIPADMTGEERENAEADIIGDIDDDQLLECLRTYREIVKAAREIRDEALAKYDADEELPMVPLEAVMSPEDAAWFKSKRSVAA